MKITKLCTTGLNLILAPFLTQSTLGQQVQIYDWHPKTPLTQGGSLDLSDPLIPKSDAIDYSGEKPLDVGRGTAANTVLDMTEVHSVQELQRDMKFDASINARYLFVSAGASVDLSSSFNSLNDSFTWVLSASVDYGRYRLVNPHLNPTAQTLYDSGKLDDFKSQYGTGFIRTVHKGAFLSAIFTINKLTQQQQQTLSSQFGISAQAAKGSGSASVSSSNFFKTALQYGAVNFHYFGTGGPGLSQLSGIIKRVDDFEAVTKILSDYAAGIDSVDKAVPIDYEAVPYSILGLKGLDPIPSVVDQQYAELMFNYFTAQGRLLRLDDLVGNASTSYSFIDPGRMGYYNQARDEHKAYVKALTNCATKLKNKEVLDSIPSVPNLLLGWPAPSATASHTLWHENSSNADFTVLYVAVYNAMAGSIRVHKPDGSIQQLGLDTNAPKEFAPLLPVTWQPLTNQYFILAQENFAWVLPGHQPMANVQVDLLSPQGVQFLTVTLGQPGSATR
jgi:hypothetical protein